MEYINKNKKVLHKPIYISGAREDCMVEVALQYNDTYAENVFTFANSINTTEGGTHLIGFRSALTRTFNNYASSNNILKNGKESLKGEDLREGLSCVISVKIRNPQFEGQTKTKLGNSEVKGLVEGIVYDKISAYLEENPAAAKQLLGKCLDAARAREGGAPSPGIDPAQKRRSRWAPCPGSSLIARNAIQPGARSTSSRATRPAVPPSKAVTGGTRRSCRCAARSSTWRRHASTKCSRTRNSR